ncbi:hypothetical protein IQ266_13295 [filamentous cyanobacterium LEGE 11480]|uniref:Uncharacterized protein n=1 Tax=Romeriopsis navalis LEGE 11480 TaxID=2777977 RepID=A0A928Z2S8_9CYAN|nr:hypothetical protein [Romeriopsis navalis]MBE9030706.1 hypothetical protein [Romeriopsis navalis LEGE 11480]
MTPFTSTLSAQRITRFLFSVIAMLGIAHLIGLTLSCLTLNPAVINAVKLINLDRERNIPTLFSVCLFILNAGLFFIVHRNTKTFRERTIAWPLLGSTFAFLALDEFGSIHEQLSEPLRNMFNLTGGAFHFAWVIPYGIAAIILAIAVIPTVLKLRPRIRKWLIAAAVIYITGAIGCEILVAITGITVSDTNFIYGLLSGIEELLEMAGLTTLTYSLLRLIEVQYGGITLIIPNQNSVYQNYSYASYTNERIPQGRQIDFTPDSYFDYPEQIPTPPESLYAPKYR